ncbi:hypothetical protein [Mycobacteroides abscessus]|uniref:hypothetical protein n=1 Tax=Mycobacteroides abscessus TaxID=36809 RepID=UPI0012FFFF17|nr:hypothetical protein [Mycobacteroides abscessus]
MTGTPSDKLYPGFDQAVPDVPTSRDVGWNQLPYQLTGVRPNQIPYAGQDKPFFGNEYFHVLEISAIPNGYRAYICDGSYNVFRPSQEYPGKYYSVKDARAANNPDVGLARVEFSKHEGKEITASQKGSNPAPLDNVFGGWHIDGSSGAYWGSERSGEPVSFDPRQAEYTERLAKCNVSMPHTAEQRIAIQKSILDTPPKAEPAVPGWPDNPA